MPQNDTKLEVGVINCLYINNLINKLVIRNAKVWGSIPHSGTNKINKLCLFLLGCLMFFQVDVTVGVSDVGQH